jgi:multiple sugar transport system permease protein
MAGSVLALVPVLTVFLLAQRYFIKGITLTGIGGR